jgi:hypothetical protein
VTETPVAAISVPYPEWDPPPRKPGRFASWLALVVVLAGAGVAYQQYQSIFGARYAERADFCPAVDVGPLSAGLATPIGPATKVDKGVPPVGDQQYCRITAAESDGTPRVAAVVTFTHYPNGAVADVQYATRRDDVARTITDRPNRRDLTDSSFGYHDPATNPPRFQVTVADSNLLITIEIAVPAGNPNWQSRFPTPAFSTLNEVIRATLKRLS